MGALMGALIRVDIRQMSSCGLWLLLRIGLIALLCGLLAAPKPALAHPLDIYLQATYITVSLTQIEVELDLSPGVLVAPEILPQLDPDGDEQISEAEGQAYVAGVLDKVLLQVDGQPLALAVTKIDMPVYLNIQAGYGTIRVFTMATLATGLSGTHQIVYTNNYAPTGSAYQVNTFVDKRVPITLGKQNRDSIQQSMTLDYVINGVIVTAAKPAATAVAATTALSTTALSTDFANVAAAFALPAGTPTQAQQLLAYLYAPTLSPWVLLLALALAVVLGGLHALTPGHGKTLVAAYLVGSRGTVGHAVTLGAVVTFTHTASVIVIGLIALFASQYIIPDLLVPILQIASGLLVIFLGARLIRQRWGSFRDDQAHVYDHEYQHAHDPNHEYLHDHGDGHVHAHLPPAGAIKLSNLLAMGVSGGLVPCPEALGIMVIAIGLNRILLGLGLIVSFSFGLAAVLIILGILLVRSRALMERFGGMGGRWSKALPLVSAVIVTVLGLGITLGGLSNFLG